VGLLNDPAILKSCLSGCERLDKLSVTAFEAAVTAKVGPIKTTFADATELSEIDPPNAYVISGEGKGGAAGFAKGSAKVRLDDDSGSTLLAYSVDARLGGKLGQLGGRVVSPIARRMADDFFGKFADTVGGAREAEPVVAASDPVPAKPTANNLFRYLLLASAAAFIALAIILLNAGD